MRRRKRRQRGEESPILGHIDWVSFCLFLALTGVGWLMIFSVGYEEFRSMSWSNFFSTDAGKQAIWIGICALLFAVIMLLDWKIWQTFAYPIYGFSLLLLILVLFLGTHIKGATSWFTFGGFSFQPSEIAKFGTALALSGFLSSYSTNLRNGRSQRISFLIILAPIILILAQPDAGSALVFFSFLLVLFREGLSANYYVAGGMMGGLLILGLVYEPLHIALGLLALSSLVLAYNLKDKKRLYWMGGAAILALGSYFLLKEGNVYTLIAFGAVSAALGALSVIQYQQRNGRLVAMLLFFLILGNGISFASHYAFNEILKPHQQDRINVWLQPDKSDERGSLYNLVQSKTAIGSGGLWGKGFTKGTMTKGNFVPEQSTDFIFCTIGEEQGFIGSFGIVALFLLLLLRITIIAERQRSNFARHYAYCVAGVIFIHFFINIAMTMGLMPIIGIPLPFISKGGSSLMGFTIMMAVMLKLDKHRYRI